MKLLAPIAAIIAAASAGQIYNSAPQQESYANSAEIYQSQLEYQQQGLYNDQSQAYTGHASHETAYEGRPSKEVAKILSYVMEQGDHGYQYSYETENGIKAQEVGQAHKGTEAHGAYSYKGDDGQTYTVTYTADEHGFRPQGAHLPTPPPIPEAIAKSIEQNAKDEAAGIYDDGKYVEQHHEQEGHQTQVHQSQGQHEIYQVQDHQSYQPQVHQSHHQVPQGHHQLNHAAIHQVQAPQTHHQQQSHYQHQQPSQVLQIVSQPYHRYEPSAFQHEGYSGHSASEALYRKH